MALLEKCASQKKGLWFSLYVDQEEIVAFIPKIVLDTHFSASEIKSDTREIYKNNRFIIDTVAHIKLKAGYPRPINLDVSDFRTAN